MGEELTREKVAAKRSVLEQTEEELRNNHTDHYNFIKRIEGGVVQRTSFISESGGFAIKGDGSFETSAVRSFVEFHLVVESNLLPPEKIKEVFDNGIASLGNDEQIKEKDHSIVTGLVYNFSGSALENIKAETVSALEDVLSDLKYEIVSRVKRNQIREIERFPDGKCFDLTSSISDIDRKYCKEAVTYGNIEVSITGPEILNVELFDLIANKLIEELDAQLVSASAARQTAAHPKLKSEVRT